jgi:hypothetical protein
VIDKDECKNKTLHGGVFKHKEEKINKNPSNIKPHMEVLSNK